MTDSDLPGELDDSQLIVELAVLLYGRSVGPSKPPMWMREASRAMGVSLGTVQGLVDGRQPSNAFRPLYAAWLRDEAERERVKGQRKRALFREARRRLR